MAIRVIVAGLGPRGCDWLRALRRAPAFEITAVADVDQQTLQQSAERFAIEPGLRFSSLEDALRNRPSEAVIVATSPDTHEAACRTSIEHGAGLLVEKPFALQVGPARSIVEAAEGARVPIVVGQNYRYMRAWRTVRQVMEQGSLGEIGSIACHYYRVPHQMSPSLARLQHAVMWGAGIHHLDALRFVLGRPVTAVSADISRAGTSIHALLEFEGNARAVYTASYESRGHEYFERGQEFYGRFTGGRATLHMIHRWLFLCEGRKFPRPVLRGSRPVSEEALLLRQLERALHHGEPPESSGRDNLQTMAVAEACIRSSSERRWVDPRELLS